MLRGMINFAQHTVKTPGTWGLTPLFFAVFRNMMQEESIYQVGNWILERGLLELEYQEGVVRGLSKYVVLIALGNQKQEMRLSIYLVYLEI